EGVSGRLSAIVDEGFESDAAIKGRLARLLSPDELKNHQDKIVQASAPTDWPYLIGLGIFTLTVVSYTLLGGFLAAVWTDLFQSVMMLIGVLMVLVLALSAIGRMPAPERSGLSQKEISAIPATDTLQRATEIAVERTGPGFVFGPGYDPKNEGRAYLP